MRVCVFVHSNRITGREAKADTALIRSGCRFVLFADQPPPPAAPKTTGRKSISLPPIPARLEEFHSLHALVQKMSLKPAQHPRTPPARGPQQPKNSNTTSVTISSGKEKRDSKEITAPTVLNWVIVCFSGRRNLMQTFSGLWGSIPWLADSSNHPTKSEAHVANERKRKTLPFAYTRQEQVNRERFTINDTRPSPCPRQV